jgi:Tfp pilus assembly protein PilP
MVLPFCYAKTDVSMEIEPDVGKYPAVLKTYDLDNLSLVDIVLEGRYAPYAWIRDPDGYVHRLFMGSNIGKNFGLVVGINDDSVWIQELVEIDEIWEERMSQLMLDKTACVHTKHEYKNVFDFKENCPEDLTAYDLDSLKVFEINLSEPSVRYSFMRDANGLAAFIYSGRISGKEDNGAIQIKGSCAPYALILDIYGYVHHVFIGSNIGKNKGIVSKIDKDYIYIYEAILDNIGNYKQRIVSLKLDESVHTGSLYSIYCPKDEKMRKLTR